MKGALRALQRVEMFWVSFSNVCMVILMVLVSVEIVARRFSHPIPGQYEFASLLMAIIVFLGLAYCQTRHGHVRMESIISRLKGKKRDFIELVVLVFSLILVAILFWQSGLLGIHAWQTGDYAPGIISFPLWPGKILVPLGLLFLGIRIIFQIVQRLGWLGEAEEREAQDLKIKDIA